MTDVNKDSAESANNSNGKNTKRNSLIVIALIIVGFILLTRQEAVNTIDCTPEIIAEKPDIVMLGAWWCTYCYQAKKYFQKNNIHYCEYDMENTAEGKRLYEKHGGGAVPILLIGKHKLSGYSEQQIEQALTLLNK